MRELCLFLLLAGCNGAASQDPVTGIYRLSILTNDDSCQPARLSGDARETEVQVAAQGMNIGVPLQSGQAWERLDLTAAAGFAGSYDQPAACGAATEHLELQRMSSTENSLEVSAIEDWTVTQPCEESPAKSCHAERTLTYSLLMKCKVPLVVQVALDGSETCTQP